MDCENNLTQRAQKAQRLEEYFFADFADLA